MPQENDVVLLLCVAMASGRTLGRVLKRWVGCHL